MVCAAVQRERQDRPEPGGGTIKYFPLLFGRTGKKGRRKGLKTMMIPVFSEGREGGWSSEGPSPRTIRSNQPRDIREMTLTTYCTEEQNQVSEREIY